MTGKQQEAIDTIMDYFKFEKVQKVMEFLDWRWFGSEEGIPTLPELKQEARRLLKHSLEEKESISTGGFHVRYISYENGDETIELFFSVDYWDETIEKDLVE
jgi:hypothetical protein